MVYLMIRPKEGLYKIGTSKNPRKRLSEVRLKTPYKDCYLYGCIDGSFELEAKLHKRFEHLSVGGEWFKRSKEIKSLFPKDVKVIEKPCKPYGKRKAKMVLWQRL
jgi:hypothetical protein